MSSATEIVKITTARMKLPASMSTPSSRAPATSRPTADPASVIAVRTRNRIIAATIHRSGSRMQRARRLPHGPPGRPVYRWLVELLERDGALATLAEARDCGSRWAPVGSFSSPASPGSARRPSSTRFLEDLDADARVLLGTCDDLSIPRPLGPIRDLVGNVSPALAKALAAGAAPHDIQTLLIAELELPPRPTVLVLEDVHWADDATFDSITVLGRRIGSLPTLLVLTFRGRRGTAGPSAACGHRRHPRRRLRRGRARAPF